MREPVFFQWEEGRMLMRWRRTGLVGLRAKGTVKGKNSSGPEAGKNSEREGGGKGRMTQYQKKTSLPSTDDRIKKGRDFYDYYGRKKRSSPYGNKGELAHFSKRGTGKIERKDSIFENREKGPACRFRPSRKRGKVIPSPASQEKGREGGL